MDWADDVAYSVHDVEDAVHGGQLDVRALRADADRSVVAEVTRSSYAPDADCGEILDALDRLQALPEWPRRHDGGRRSLATLKNLTSELIGRFCAAAERATRAAYGGGRLTRYAADLLVPSGTRLEVAVLKGAATHYVMTSASRLAVLAEQRELLRELVARLERDAPGSLAPPFRADWAVAADDAARRRVVVDQVASLTDTSAAVLHDARRRG